MKVVFTAGDGRRHLFERDLMGGHYEPPGIEFVPASEHSHDTEHPVARCVADVGEVLVERSGFKRLSSVLESDVDAATDDGADADDTTADRDADGRFVSDDDTDSEDS